MGRKPTKNSNLPPHMRKRVRKSGTYYFLDTGDKPRKEIPLGSDYILALKRYAEIHEIGANKSPMFNDLIIKYETEALPLLSKSTIRVQTSDIKHLRSYFAEAPLDQVTPEYIERFKRKHKDKPTTANRCMRLISTMWNLARAWGYTNLPNPRTGIKGHKLSKRTVYITDAVFEAVHAVASEPLRDAMDLAYLTGQRPGDALRLTEHDIANGNLIVTQDKTSKPLRIQIIGKLAEVIERIHARKATYKIVTGALLVNTQGKRLTPAVLRNHFVEARTAARAKNPKMDVEIAQMWFYDLRAKAADDTSDERGDQGASDLLGHENVSTTRRHYLRRGKIVDPVK